MSELPRTEILFPERLHTNMVVRTLSIASHIQEQFLEELKEQNKNEYWVHKGSKGIYQIMGYCLMQVNSQFDMAYAVIYQNVETRSNWCRPKSEFDARFVRAYYDDLSQSFVVPDFTSVVNNEGEVK